MVLKSALACAKLIPSFNLANTISDGLSRRISSGAKDRGIQRSIGWPNPSRSKPAGRTPTTVRRLVVNGDAATDNIAIRAEMPRPDSVTQNYHADRGQDCSSSAPKVRPNTGLTPSMVKNPGET